MPVNLLNPFQTPPPPDSMLKRIQDLSGIITTQQATIEKLVQENAQLRDELVSMRNLIQ